MPSFGPYFQQIETQAHGLAWCAFGVTKCRRCGLRMRTGTLPIQHADPPSSAKAAGLTPYAWGEVIPVAAAGDAGICERCAGYASTADQAIHLDEIVARTSWIRSAWTLGDPVPDPPRDLVWTGRDLPPAVGSPVVVARRAGVHRGRVAALEIDAGRVWARVTLDERDPDHPDAPPIRVDGIDLERAAPTDGQIDATSTIAATIERVWAVIAERHDDLPPIAVSIRTGNRNRKGGRDRMTWGHFAANRWTQRADGARLHELMVAGELLALGGSDVLAVLLHEAAHALAEVRQIKDTSRGGRYHNARFRDLAAGVGLVVQKGDRHGWHVTTLRPDTAAAYRDAIAMLDEVCSLHAVGGWRRLWSPDDPTAPDPVPNAPTPDGESEGEGEGEGEGQGDGPKPKRGGLTMHCQCPEPRRIRVSLAVAEGPPIRCDACGEPFAAE